MEAWISKNKILNILRSRNTHTHKLLQLRARVIVFFAWRAILDSPVYGNDKKWYDKVLDSTGSYWIEYTFANPFVSRNERDIHSYTIVSSGA